MAKNAEMIKEINVRIEELKRIVDMAHAVQLESRAVVARLLWLVARLEADEHSAGLDSETPIENQNDSPSQDD